MEERNFATRVIIALALVAIAVLLWKLAAVLMMGFAGIVLATALRAASVPLARKLRIPPAAAVVIVVVAIVAISGVGGYLFGKQIADQADAIRLAVERAPATIASYLQGTRFGTAIVESFQGATSSETLAKLAEGTVTAFGMVADLGLVLFLAGYLAAEPETYRRGALLLLPVAARKRVDDALDSAGDALRKWLVGQLGAMVTVGALIGIALGLLGAPLALPLGILSGLLEFVPVVGPLTALFVGVLVAFSQGPDMALYVAIVYSVVLFVEGNIIIPLAQKWAVALPPALGLLGIVVFGVLFGLVGVLFAMPLLVVVVTLVQKLYVERGQKADG
ncbi:MAG: AI-2E family transporter [Usitatibacter sp.]